VTHHSKFLKSRVEKKIVKRYLDRCQGCGMDHVSEPKLDSSRRRRIDSEMRRVRRRELRHDSIPRPSVKGFSSEFQAKLYETFIKYVYGDVMEKLTFDVEFLPLPGESMNSFKRFLGDFEMENYVGISTSTPTEGSASKYEDSAMFSLDWMKETDGISTSTPTEGS